MTNDNKKYSVVIVPLEREGDTPILLKVESVKPIRRGKYVLVGTTLHYIKRQSGVYKYTFHIDPSCFQLNPGDQTGVYSFTSTIVVGNSSDPILGKVSLKCSICGKIYPSIKIYSA